MQKKKEKIFLHGKSLIPESYKVEERILEEVFFDTEFDNSENSEINIFGKKFNFSDPAGIDWHLDIFSGLSFPRIFAKSINILANPNISAKVVWEVNRLQFLMKIAIDYNRSKNIERLNHFTDILSSWFSGNPYLTGINWYSNIEVNLRLINWFLCWEVIDADNLVHENKKFKEFVENEWMPSIYNHCLYSFQNPSKYSSANNHLISEYSGLFIASSKWKFPESEKWNKYSKRGLEVEIVKQHSPKGINKEEAAEYIQFITDFFLVAYIVGAKTGNHFSHKYKSYLKNIFEYIFNLIDANGNFPTYGDEDDGKCFIIDFSNGFNNFKSLLTSGAIIFNDVRFKAKSNGFDLKNMLLFGNSNRHVFDSIPNITIDEKSEFYIEEGHFFFRKKELNKETYLHFDAAPLGFLSIAAHGHADALSIILHIDGYPVLVDPGTYTYHTDKKWRNYFISTMAHNTICIDGINQALQGGPTLWLKHYKTEILDVMQKENVESVTASHNGYRTIGCYHQRSVLFDQDMNRFLITDELELDDKEHDIFQPWHLHPLVDINLVDNHTYKLKHKSGTREIKIKFDSKLILETITGKLNPLLGWYSPSFLQKKQTSVIFGKMKTTTSQKIQFQTIIEIL